MPDLNIDTDRIPVNYVAIVFLRTSKAQATRKIFKNQEATTIFISQIQILFFWADMLSSITVVYNMETGIVSMNTWTDVLSRDDDNLAYSFAVFF